MNAHPNDPDPAPGGAELARYNGLDRRLIVLETRFDTILPTLATKRDIEDLRREFSIGLERLRGEFHTEIEKLRAEFFKAIHDTMRWMIGIVVTMFIGLLGVNFATFNAMKALIESNRPAAPVIERKPAPDGIAPRAAPDVKVLP